MLVNTVADRGLCSFSHAHLLSRNVTQESMLNVDTKSAFHLSELTGLRELVLPGPNGKAVANLRDYARDMTCLRGQLRVFRNVNEQTWRMCCLS